MPAQAGRLSPFNKVRVTPSSQWWGAMLPSPPFWHRILLRMFRFARFQAARLPRAAMTLRFAAPTPWVLRAIRPANSSKDPVNL